MTSTLHISQRYLMRSDSVRRPRAPKNDANWQAYRCEQDWSHKASFQSQECTPSFPIAVEHIVGTFERALTDSDEWLTADNPGVGQDFLDPESIKGMTKFYLERLWTPGNKGDTSYSIQAFVGDSCKRGILEPVIVAKVYPVMIQKRSYRFLTGKPAAEFDGAVPAYDYLGDNVGVKVVESMRLAIDLIPYNDFFPDPSEANNYRIHRTRRQLHELLANPEYDPEAVRRLLGKAAQEHERMDRSRTTGEKSIQRDPYEVEVYEGWGNIIDETSGEMLFANVFWTWCGDEILREPTPNPFWDGSDPFIEAPLIRVPGSTEHKALADHVVPMWRLSNEMINLISDASLRAAWGIGQMRTDIMENPEEVAEGIPQGYTAVLKPNTPINAKFYERVDEAPRAQMTLDGLDKIEGYLQQGLAIPDTKFGTTPGPGTSATATVQALQQSGSLYENFAARYEDTFLEPLFEKSWKVILQWSDHFMEEELISILGPRRMLQLTSMKPVERWQLLHKVKFKVRGLRQLANRERNFQKKMVLLQQLQSDPQFADFFGRNYDYDKLYASILVDSGVDPEAWRLDPDQQAEADAQAAPAQPIAGGQLDASLGAGSGASAPNISGPEANSGMQSGLAPANPNAGGALG